jgi:hypothetical protein
MAPSLALLDNIVSENQPDAEAPRRAEQEQKRLEYKTQVLQLLQQNGRLGIVNSIITACDLTMRSGTALAGHAGAGAGTGPAGGPINVNVRAGYERSRDVGEQGTYVGESLVACSYLPLKLHPASSIESRRKRTLRVFARGPPAQQDGEWSLGMREIWELGPNEIPGDTARLLHAEAQAINDFSEDTDPEPEPEEFEFWIKGTEEVNQDEGNPSHVACVASVPLRRMNVVYVL